MEAIANSLGRKIPKLTAMLVLPERTYFLLMDRTGNPSLSAVVPNTPSTNVPPKQGRHMPVTDDTGWAASDRG